MGTILDYLDPCCLCGEHTDLQEISFQCPEVLDKIKVNEDYDNVFGPKIRRELAKNVQDILKIRDKV